jgi:hypothetical protein
LYYIVYYKENNRIGDAILSAFGTITGNQGDVLYDEDEKWLVRFYKFVVSSILSTGKKHQFINNTHGKPGNRLYDHVTCSDESLALYVIKLYYEGAQDEILESSASIKTPPSDTSSFNGMTATKLEDGDGNKYYRKDVKGRLRPVKDKKVGQFKAPKKINAGNVYKESNLNYFGQLSTAFGTFRSQMSDEATILLDSLVRDAMLPKKTKTEQNPVSHVVVKRNVDEDVDEGERLAYMNCYDGPFAFEEI